jgi:hypothetical protein
MSRTEYYMDWILSETGMDEPTEAPPATTDPPTTQPTTQPTTAGPTLPPFTCPDGWVDNAAGCYKLLHTEVVSHS